MTKFENSRTIEQLKAETRSAKLFFHYAFKKDANGVNRPLYINDAEGKPTNVQAVAVHNEAGNTVAWCSREVAAEIAQGMRPDAKPLSVVDVYDEESGAMLGTKLVHPKSNAIAGLEL